MGVLDVVPRTKNMGLLDHIWIEGDPNMMAADINGSSLTDEMATNVGGLLLTSVSRAFWVEQFVVTSNKQIDFQIDLSGSAAGIAWQHRLVVYPGVPCVIPVRLLIRPHHLAAGSLVAGSCKIRVVLDADPTNGRVHVRANGHSVYDDFNYGADKVILWVGDSITNGTAGVTSKALSYEWRLREWFREQGQNVRLIGRSLSGTASADHERYRAAGALDFERIDLICYSLGANDTVSVPNYTANLNAMIDWKQQRYPGAKMIVFGPTPMENNTVESQMVLLRAAATAAVTAQADAKVVYCSLGTAFDRTNTANYASSDSAGSHVHPSNSGHAAIDTVVRAFLAGQAMVI